MAPQSKLSADPGTDVSGTVAAVGENVSQFKVNDEVYAMVRFPHDLMTGSSAYAEYVRVPVSELALKPAGIDHIGLPVRPCRFDRLAISGRFGT